MRDYFDEYLMESQWDDDDWEDDDWDDKWEDDDNWDRDGGCTEVDLY